MPCEELLRFVGNMGTELSHIKLDAEGQDRKCLQSVLNGVRAKRLTQDHLPATFGVEGRMAGVGVLLKKLGYKKFKLVAQDVVQHTNPMQVDNICEGSSCAGQWSGKFGNDAANAIANGNICWSTFDEALSKDVSLQKSWDRATSNGQRPRSTWIDVMGCRSDDCDLCL